ncbi:MAG: hypothetical protein ACREUT_19020 [Steroidobacteraceae bacterium]
MRRLTRFLILTGVSTLAACASQTPATSGGAAATTSADTGASTHTVPDGYQREVINGSEEFCRNDAETGSRVVRQKVCVTWEQLQAEERSNTQITRGSGPVN